MKLHDIGPLAVLFMLGFGVVSARAEIPEYTISILNHVFQPSEVTVPVGEKFKLIVVNKDSTPEEFESHDLQREKIVKGGSQIAVLLGPLEPGRYEFFGEFYPKTARGFIIAKHNS